MLIKVFLVHVDLLVFFHVFLVFFSELIQLVLLQLLLSVVYVEFVLGDSEVRGVNYKKK